MKLIWKALITVLFIISCCISCSRGEQSVPGYIEGEYTYIASGVSGTLFDLYVKRGQTVAKGDLLYALDSQPELAKVTVAQANIADMAAQVAFAKDQLARQQKLYLKNVASAVAFDSAQTDFLSKSQQLSAYKAQLAQ